jgi:hypothetical protein
MLLVKFTDLSEAEQRRAGPYLLYFINGKGQANTERIAAREKQLQFGMLLAATLRARMIELDQRLKSWTQPHQMSLRQATMDVGVITWSWLCFPRK